MTKLIWWLRIVGSFNLLLSLWLVDGSWLGHQVYSQTLAIKSDQLGAAIKAIRDIGPMFVLELALSGALALYASRHPQQSGSLIVAVIWAEVFRGALAEAVWMRQGYAATSYLPLGVVHLLVIAMGLWFFWQASARPSGEPLEQ